MKALIVSGVLLCCGCAVRKPGFQSYRLVTRGTNAVLVPPGVANAAVEQRTFIASVPAGTCTTETGGAVAIQAHGKRLRVTVHRDELMKQPPNWLSEWAAQLEARGCIGAGAWWELADQVAESVPLDTRTAFRLLYGEAVDIGPQIRIQVDSPILRDETSAESLIANVSEATTGLNVGLQSSDNLLGYERAWYRVQAKSGGSGLTIVPLTAERHINGVTEERSQPAKNPFDFSPAAGYYRLIYKQEQTEFTALVVAGRTRSELDEHAKKLETGTARCERVEKGLCVAIPRGVAANLFVPVTINGKEELVHWGASVGDAIRNLRGRMDATEAAAMSITKLHNGKPAAVEFDRSGTAILGLRLMGGETISWQ